MNKNLILFDRFGKREEMIFEGLRYIYEESGEGSDAGTLEGLVLADCAFLPEGVTSVFDAYIGEWEQSRKFCNLYYAFIQVPEYWMVMPYLSGGAIYDMGIKKGEIYVRHPLEKRLVERVDWLDGEQVIRKDYYDRYGTVYKCDHMDKSGNCLESSWYTSRHQEVLNWNHTNQVFGALTKNNLRKYYHTAEEWIREYAGEVYADYSGVILTSEEQKDWFVPFNGQEYGECFLSDVEKEEGFCYVSGKTPKWIENKQETVEILILTTSDQLEGIERLTAAFEHCSFHIAATTAFSPKLYELEKQRKNVHLYSTVSNDRLCGLLERCTVYLDINHAYTYPDSVEMAALNGLLLMGFKDTVGKRQYFMDGYILEDVQQMEERLEMLSAFPEKIKTAAAAQHKQQKEIMLRQMKDRH